MSSSTNNQGTLYNLTWKFAERISAQLISMIVSIVLARILSPSDYGAIAIVMIFITLLNVLINDGFGSALIQKKNATAIDFFSVLYFNIIFSIVLYVILFFCAPYITNFFGNGYEVLTPVIRTLGLGIIFTAINSVQQAYVSKKMMFRLFFISTIWGTIISAIVGLVMAYMGFGVWALVAQHLIYSFVCTLTLTIVINKKPRCIFSKESLRSLFPFGIRILGTGLLITGYIELRAIIIGKMYSPSDLAYYDKGKQFPNIIVNNINSSISAVLFPKMSLQQDDTKQIKETTRKSIKFSSYIMCPLMLGLAAVAEPFVRVILTEKWISCVPLLQWFCIIYLFQPIHSANMQAIKAIGRSDVYMKLEIIKKIIELIVLVIVMWYSVNAIVVSMAVCTTLFMFLNTWPNTKLLNYTLKQQLIDILPNIMNSFIMFVCVYFMGKLPLNEILLLTIQVCAGVFIYILLSSCSHNKEYAYIKNLCIKKIKK